MPHSAKPNLIPVFALLVAGSFHAPARAQSVAMTVHVGTLGLGADVALPLQPNLGVRASLNYFPFHTSWEGDSIAYRLDLPSPQVMLLVDLFPAGQFRLTGGVLIKWSDFDVTGRLTEPRMLGDAIYTPEEVGNLVGRVATHDLSPYLGIGFGKPGASAIGFFFDFGVAFHGNPQVSARADGPVASDPNFQQDLALEVQSLQEDLENIIVYPVFSVGISIRLGR